MISFVTIPPLKFDLNYTRDRAIKEPKMSVFTSRRHVQVTESHVQIRGYLAVERIGSIFHGHNTIM
jgi:hypothetical protein